MIIIKTLNVSKPFRYIWLKSVKDVDLSKHCAKCLIGEYSKTITASIKHYENLNLENDIYYLCGVSSPYNWYNNFHLAFTYSEGNVINYSNNGIEITVENAKSLPISTEFIDPFDTNYTKNQYRTCRNWQFAHYFKKHLK